MFFREAEVHAALVPEFAKSAVELQPVDLAKLPGSAFADQARTMPIHTKAACALSAIRLYSQGQVDTQEESRIVKQAAFFGISEDVSKIKQELVKEAAPLTDDDYAIVVSDGTRTLERRQVLKQASDIVNAAEFLYKNRDRYPYAVRKSAAVRILRKAAELDIQCFKWKDYAEKAAGYGYQPIEKLAQQLSQRKYLYHSDNAKEVADVITYLTQATDVPELERVEKVACALDYLDRENKTYRQYTKGVRTPEELCFATPLTELQKMAATEEELSLVGGMRLPLSKLANLKASALTPVGADLVACLDDGKGGINIEQARAILPTLPADSAATLMGCVG